MQQYLNVIGKIGCDIGIQLLKTLIFTGGYKARGGSEVIFVCLKICPQFWTKLAKCPKFWTESAIFPKKMKIQKSVPKIFRY